MLKIGLDIDNVLANFNKAYIKRFKVSPNRDTLVTRRVERTLSKDKKFWLNLEPLNKPDFIPTLYCSARVNKKSWTKEYLRKNDFPNVPLYQVPGYIFNKAKYIKGRVDVFIDDSVKNFKQMNESGVPCLLFSTDDNKYFETEGRVNSLCLEEIERVFNNFIKTSNE